MKKRNLLKAMAICTIFLALALIINNWYISFQKNKQESLIIEEIPQSLESHDNIYIECLNQEFYTENTEKLIKEFLIEYQSENIALYFTDIKNNYTIKKNENKSFYGASVIKLLEATYILRKAMAGKINLEDKIVYKAKFKSLDSIAMEKYKIGEKISLKELVKYIISYSDNTAHEMIFDYIGINSLKEYADSLKIKLTINENEHFGLLTTNYTNLILKEALDIISKNNEYGDILSTAMDNDYFNSFNFENIRIIHKYGLYASTYNEIGIYNSQSPYLISIFTNYGYQDYELKTKEISKKIFNIYNQNNTEKEIYCKNLQNANIK